MKHQGNLPKIVNTLQLYQDQITHYRNKSRERSPEVSVTLVKQKKKSLSKTVFVKQNEEELEEVMIRHIKNCSDVNEWVRRNRLDLDQKVFIAPTNYQAIREALQERGWVENPEFSSHCFHLKFCFVGSDLSHKYLRPYQVTNHFQDTSCFTTKAGLNKTIRDSVYTSSIGCDEFFPKCFDCTE